GFAIPRDPFNAVTDYSDPLQLGALYALSKALKVLGSSRRYRALSRLIDGIVTKPNQTPAPTIEEYAAACTGTLRHELAQQRINTKDLMLQIEPGRAIHGDTGIH
ncbi:MAG: hypothetical protein GTO24_01155, partial [candidate division Zixibacteria bacterium]|nr:hypothetical protein [candidate division Zixibacteria bacterium]